MSTSYTSSLPRSVRGRPRITSDLFRTPATPSTTSQADLLQSTKTPVPASRKRSRADAIEASNRTSYSIGWTKASADFSTFRERDAQSPPPLVNTRYRLAGGLDTPTRATAEYFEQRDAESEVDLSRRWGIDEGSKHVFNAAGPLEREGNGRVRAFSSTEEERESWGTFVIDVVGGLAGKVWDFCRTSAFRGFQAGRGTGYAFEAAVPKPIPCAGSWMEDTNSVTLPGRFPDDRFMFATSPAADDAELRPAKRLQTDQASGWVMVDHYTPAQTSPPRKNSYSSPATRSYLPRPVNDRISASRHRARPQTARLTSTTSPYLNRPQSASTAPLSRSPVRHVASPRSPASAEVQQYAARREKEERANNASMRKLNQQLRAMIQEGQAALATEVVVVDDENGGLVDEGYEGSLSS